IILGLTDWDTSNFGRNIRGYEVLDPYELNNIQFDYVLIVSQYYDQIKEQLSLRCNIIQEQILKINPYTDKQQWEIGLAQFNEKSGVSFLGVNPIIECSFNSQEIPYCVADPFIFKHNNVYYLFYEKLLMPTQEKRKGVIMIATSQDGINFQNHQQILEEDVSISFPIVYKQGKQFYMTIHSVHSEDVRLYVSTEFPYKWK